MKQRAISPIIATVILVAVTIALAVGVALWFSGIIGGAGSHEQLLVLPDGNIVNGTQGSAVYIHVKNSGSVDAQIISIKVGNMNAPLTGSNVNTTGGFSIGNNYIIVPAGKDGWINITLSDNPFIPGTSYKVTIVTAAGNSYIQELQTIQGS